MPDRGDIPIDFAAHQFTLPEAAELSGVPEKTIRNWMARSTIDVGSKHFLGRWLFSGFDVVRLTVMSDLTLRLPLPPSAAVPIVFYVVDYAKQYLSKHSELGREIAATPHRPNTNLVVWLGEGGTPVALEAHVNRAGFQYPPMSPDKGDPAAEGKAAVRRTHIIIPMTALVFDVHERIFALLEKEDRNDD